MASEHADAMPDSSKPNRLNGNLVRFKNWRRGRATRAQARATSRAGRHVTGRQRAVRVGIIFLTAVIICGYLDRSEVEKKGGLVGFSYFERFPHRVRLSMAWARHSEQIQRTR